jgi:hypothetical protein
MIYIFNTKVTRPKKVLKKVFGGHSPRFAGRSAQAARTVASGHFNGKNYPFLPIAALSAFSLCEEAKLSSKYRRPQPNSPFQSLSTG